MPVSDWDCIVDPGEGRARRFYAGGTLIAADKVGAVGTTITVDTGQTVPLCSESAQSGQWKLQNRDGSLLYPIIVTPPPVNPPSGGGNSNKPWSAASLWNSPINQATAVYTNPGIPSISSLGGGWCNLEQDSFPVWFTTNSDPLWTITSGSTKWRTTLSFTFHAPANWAPNTGGSDNASVIANTDTGEMVELGVATKTGTTSIGCSGYGRMFFTTGDGFANGASTFATDINSGVRAVGCSGWGGLITKPDLSGGPILHALCCSLPGTALAFDTSSSDTAGFTFPAIQCDAGGTSNSGPIKEGARLAIPPGTANPGGVLGSGLGLIMFNTSRDYGWFVVDRSPTVGLYADKNQVTSTDIGPIRENWRAGGSIIGNIWPLLRVVTNY